MRRRRGSSVMSTGSWTFLSSRPKKTISSRREVPFHVRIWFMAECHSEASILKLRYESLVESMRKKFAKKRNLSTITKSEEDINCNVANNQLKKVFLKPQD